MASMWLYNSIDLILDGTLDLSADTIKVGLSTATHVLGLDDTFLDDASADDFSSGEISNASQSPVSGYVGEFNGAGRKTLASKTFNVDATTKQARFDAADPSAWTLGTGATVAHATLMKEVTNDAATRAIIYLDFTGVPTNGGTFTLQFHADGIGVADAG